MQEDLGRMSRLVDDLLTLARLDGGAALRLSPILLADLLAAAAHEGRTISAGRQRIVEVPVPGDLVVWGDRDRLRQVLSNLVGNACAYCPPGSTIMLGAVRCDDWAVVTVRDDGPGIPNADLARLGERFYRGDAARSRRTGGTGLGLAIARAVVEAHGGTLSIDSTPGVGTAVTVRVPLAALTPPRPPELPARSATST
jgi:signal transduction histidine kinase